MLKFLAGRNDRDRDGSAMIVAERRSGFNSLLWNGGLTSGFSRNGEL